jgi:hypothetical protein
MPNAKHKSEIANKLSALQKKLQEEIKKMRTSFTPGHYQQNRQ